LIKYSWVLIGVAEPQPEPELELLEPSIFAALSQSEPEPEL
jgi:hypothetical protein